MFFILAYLASAVNSHVASRISSACKETLITFLNDEMRWKGKSEQTWTVSSHKSQSSATEHLKQLLFWVFDLFCSVLLWVLFGPVLFCFRFSSPIPVCWTSLVHTDVRSVPCVFWFREVTWYCTALNKVYYPHSITLLLLSLLLNILFFFT